jgi:hypothetical protein
MEGKRTLLLSGLLMAGLAGCGIPGPPQPPSLNLPQIVGDLQAQRLGDAVELRWTAPGENTDKTAVKAATVAKICREDAVGEACKAVGQLASQPGAAMEYTDMLPGPLTSGPARAIAYEVATENARGRSAGWSAAEPALAGTGAPAVTQLAAENTADGIKLSWKNGGNPPGMSGLLYRITRTRETATATAPGKAGSFGTAKTPPVQVLEVKAGASPVETALDSQTAWDETYRYQVQAVEQVRLEAGNGPRTLEMLGAGSNAVEVQTKNVFPPAAPRGLAVVPVWGSDGKPGMDLNWEPNTGATLAGYQVYRITQFAHRALERRQMVSGDKLLTSPSFDDRGLEAGTTYKYTVVAVDTAGNVSAESNEVVETARISKD